MKDSIDERLEEFLKIGTGEGLKYMDCEWSSKGNSGEGPCTEAHLSYPPGPSPGPRTVTFTMRDETGFYDALASKAGIQREWITWRDMDAINDPCVCPPTQPGICPVDCTMNYYMRKNWPKRVSDKDKIEIENPKSIIEEAIPSTDVLVGTIVGTYIEMRMGVLDADEADVLTAFSMPLLMMQDASNSIKEIKEIGKEQKETKTRELVLGILSIVFAVIPFAGQAASALGGAARLATGIDHWGSRKRRDIHCRYCQRSELGSFRHPWHVGWCCGHARWQATPGGIRRGGQGSSCSDPEDDGIILARVSTQGWVCTKCCQELQGAVNASRGVCKHKCPASQTPGDISLAHT